MRIGSLFSGYGGLDMAVANATGATTAWVSDIDKGACKILAHRYADVPNIGDLTAVDWAQVEPVDILTGGFPCQDLSHAGKRAGLRPNTRSGLWTHMAYAIDQLRPRLVVAENVRGLLSAGAHSDVEPCPFCMGDGSGVHLRALGAVLGDLADLGYDASWYGLRAADVGAPHGRFRVFLVAYPAGNSGRVLDGEHDAVERLLNRVEDFGADEVMRRRIDKYRNESLLRTPTAQLAVNGGSQHPEKRRAGGHGPTLADEVEHLLPTPAVNDMGAGKTVDDWDAWTDRMKAEHGNGNGHGKSLAIEAARLLPTPMAAEGTKPSNTMGVERRAATGEVFLTNVIVSQFGNDPFVEPIKGHGTWGPYAPAIHRWEQVLGRPAPDPTEPTGKGGAHRLSPAFVEWMMGLPTGWITDVPGITRNEALKACGNGVVPQQAMAALNVLLGQAVAA